MYLRIGLRRLTVCAVLCLSADAIHAQQDLITAQIDTSRTVVLTGRMHSGVNPANDLGAVGDSFQITGITISFKKSASQQSELQRLLEDQQNLSSPQYHKWLTPEQYADRFGVSPNDFAKIAAWLESQGFIIGNQARSRGWVAFSGTAQQVRSAFHTAIHHYNVNRKIHYANASDPSLPATLAGVVAGLSGLNDFHPVTQYKKQAVPEITTGGVHHLAPDDLATIYDINPLYAAGVDGAGQKIAIVGQTRINLTDIQGFRTKFNLSSPSIQQVLVPGFADPGISPLDEVEADLDIEWSGAVARSATIVYVYSDDVFTSAMYAIDQNLAPVLSMSYGACEQSDLVDLPLYQSVAQQANSQGMTWLADAGDSGAAGCDPSESAISQDGLAVNVPASIPEVTAMGGTEFNEGFGTYWSASNTPNDASALSYIPEIAWNDTADGGGLAASGGGASIFFPKPVWQSGLQILSDNARHVPDVSLNSSNVHDNYYVYTGGSFGYYGGTSFAAPIMAGIIGLLNQYLVNTGIQSQPGLANINPALYGLAQSATGIFHDIVAGNNSVPCAAGSPNCFNGSIGFNAGPGYDQVTGLGSMDTYQLVHQWSNSPLLSSAIVPSVSSNPVFQHASDANGYSWSFFLTLNEEAGIATTLTDFTINGASQAAQIRSFFGSATIPPRGSIGASLGYASLAVPETIVFGFTGIDASGQQWTTQLSAAFEGPQIPPTITGICNAASCQQAFAPGMIMSVYGTQLGNSAQSTATIPLPQYLAEFTAGINGVSAPLYYVSSGLVNLQIPYETLPGLATLTVSNSYQTASRTFVVAPSAPGIFAFSDGAMNPMRSGSRGEEAFLYITGDGQVTPALATGATPPLFTPVAQLPHPLLPVRVTVGGVAAANPFAFIGIPSGLVGATQINFTIPETAPLGMQPVVVTVGGASSMPAYFTVTQ